MSLTALIVIAFIIDYLFIALESVTKANKAAGHDVSDLSLKEMADFGTKPNPLKANI